MLNEHLTASLVNRLAFVDPITMMDGYYRSKLFITPSQTNPLIAAAGPLFSLIERLSVSNTLPPIDAIRDNIEHELFAFYSNLNAAKYSAELIGLARYLLCATIDELLAKSYMRLYQDPVQFKAFTPLSMDEVDPSKRFFEVVNYIKERPNQHLDAIELAYFCLITGFEGQEHFNAGGRQNLDNLIEELFRLIQKYRVNKPLKLFHDTPSMPTYTTSKRISVTLTTLLAIGVLGLAFCTGRFFLDIQAKTILAAHTQFDFKESQYG